MQTAMQGDYRISQIDPMSFMNMDPTNLNTIYTAILIAVEECEKQDMTTCFVTFDQSVFIKASQIVGASDDLSNVVVRLGGFHLLISFMGAAGNIMAGGGLEELWSTVYAKASVVHILTGHAYARAHKSMYISRGRTYCRCCFEFKPIFKEYMPRSHS